MQAVFTNEGKRKIAIRLVSSGRWRACDWPALSAVVRSGILGLDEEGQVVAAPNAAELLASGTAWAEPVRRRSRRNH